MDECEQRMPKRNRAQPMNSLKDESAQLGQVETVLEDSKLDVSEENEIGDGEWEDPSAEHMRDKATRADGAATPYHLWNNRVADKLEEFWKSEGYKNPQPTKRKDGSPGRQGASTKPKLNFKDLLDRLKLSRVLRTLRTAASTYWKKLVKKCFWKWFESHGRDHTDQEEIKTAGEAAIAKAAETSWWEWKSGSTIFFWRWPPDYQDVVRKGLLPMFDSEPPVNSDRQPPYDDNEIKEKVKNKLDKVIMKGYVELTDIKFVEAMMFMFDVPKGDDI
jgi:hypothetical protein